MSRYGIFHQANVAFRALRKLTVPLLLLALLGCSSATEEKKAATLSSIAIGPAAPLVTAGVTVQLTVTARFSDNSTQDITSRVTWSSSNTSTVTVSTSGLLTGVAEGSATVTASDPTSGLTATANATVTAATPTAVSIDQSAPTLAATSELQLTATGTFSDGSELDVTASVVWAVSSTNGNASVGTDGVVTAGSSTGTETITATLGSMAPASVTVEVAQLTSLAITDSVASVTVIAANTERQLTATGTLTRADTSTTTQDLTTQAAWTSSDTAVAAIDSAATETPARMPPAGAAAMLFGRPPVGIIIPPGVTPGLLEGTATGIATINASFNGVPSSGRLVEVAALTGLASSSSSLTVPADDTSQLTATATLTRADSSTATQDVTSYVSWGSFNPSLATVSAAGLVTGVSEGTTQIAGTFGGQIVQVSVTVEATLDAITVSSSGGTTLFPTSTLQLSASGYYLGSTDTPRSITDEVTWSTSDSAVATVSDAAGSKGLVTGVAAGSVDITATLGSVSASLTLTVSASSLTSISVTPANPTTVAPLTVQFVATGTFADGDRVLSDVTWSSDDPAVTIDSATGLATAVSAGSAPITATDNATSLQGSTTLTVDATSAPGSITVTPASATLASGQSQTFSADGVFATAVGTLSLAGRAAWSSDNTALVIDPVTGVATAAAGVVSPVSVTVTASYAGVDGTASVTVTPPVVTAISVSPSPLSIPAGRIRQFAAIGLHSDGTVAPIASGLTWSSSNPGAMTIVAGTGLATAVGTGSTTISATDGTVTGSAAVTVTAAVLSSLTLSPPTATLTSVGATQVFTLSGLMSDGSAAPTTALTPVTWSTSNAAVATISTTGVATAVFTGLVSIAARAGTVVGQAALTVNIDSQPVASIAQPASNQSINAGDDVIFAGAASSGDAPLTYAWNFDVNASGGGPSPSTALNPGTVNFPTAGTFLVRFTVTDADGDTDSAEVTIAVTGTGTAPRLSDALPLYDDFFDDTLQYGEGLDNARWDAGHRTTELEEFSGNQHARLTVTARNLGLTNFPDTRLTARSNATSIETKMDVSEMTATNARGEAIVRIMLQPKATFGQTQSGFWIFDVRVTRVNQGPLVLGPSVFRCEDENCVTITAASGVGSLTTTPAFNTPITVGVSVTDTLATLTVEGESRTFNLTSYGISLADYVATPRLQVRVTNPGQSQPLGGTGEVDVKFDDVKLDGALYDDFESGTQIDPTKWVEGQTIAEVSIGSLFLQQSADSYSASNFIYPRNPTAIRAMAADVTVSEVGGTNSAAARAGLAGFFFNDGTAGDGLGGLNGEIFAEVGLNADSAGYAVRRCITFDCVGNELVGSVAGALGASALGETHTLYLAWDGADGFTFQMDATPEVVVNTGLTVNPSESFFFPRHVGTRTSLAGGQTATIFATIDNFRAGDAAGSLAASLPILDDFRTTRFLPQVWTGEKAFPFKTEIVNGAYVTDVSSTGNQAGLSDGFGLTATDPSIVGLAADVQMLVDTGPFNNAQGSINGRFYVDTSGRFVEASLSLNRFGDAEYDLIACFDNLNCTRYLDSPQTITTGLDPSSVHNLSMLWDAGTSTFHFNVDNGTPVDVDFTAAPYASVYQLYPLGLQTWLEFPNAGVSGNVTVSYDNVTASTGAGFISYDTFDGPDISLANWKRGALSRLVQNTALELRAENSTTELRSKDSLTGTEAVSAEVTLTEQSGDGMAALLRPLYQDAQGGDIFAGIGMGDTGAYWLVFQCINDCVADDSAVRIAGDSLGAVTLGSTHTLYMDWDGTNARFQLDAGTPVTFNPTITNPVVSTPAGLLTIPIVIPVDVALSNPITLNGSVTATYDNLRAGPLPVFPTPPVTISGTISYPEWVSGVVWLLLVEDISADPNLYGAKALPGGTSIPYAFDVPPNVGAALLAVIGDHDSDLEFTHFVDPCSNVAVTVGSSDVTGVDTTVYPGGCLEDISGKTPYDRFAQDKPYPSRFSMDVTASQTYTVSISNATQPVDLEVHADTDMNNRYDAGTDALLCESKVASTGNESCQSVATTGRIIILVFPEPGWIERDANITVDVTSP